MLSSLSKGKFFSGYCPTENCNATVLHSETTREAECWSCKSKCLVSSLIDRAEILDRSDALIAFINILTGTPVKPEPPITKVHGLSTYHCKLLSPLLTLYGIDKMGRAKTIHELKNCAIFDCSWLGDRSFTIEPDYIDLPGYGQDTSGSAGYLNGTLSLLRSYNNDRDALVPLHVDGDGHCLVHAISRAIVGRELFWHALRTGLKLHLTENLPKYKELLNDFINSSEWEDIIAECDPDYAPRDNEMLGLRNIHIFGLANVLRRPILLVDSVAGMQSSGDYSALFLPGLIPPDQCRDRNGALNKPICLAWSSSGRNHYIPLVGIRGCDAPLFPRTLLPKVWGVSQTMIENYIEFNQNECLAIGGGKLMQDSYLMKLASGMDALFHQKYGIDPSLVADAYYCNFVKAAVFDAKPNEVLSATKTALQERRLVRCLNCTSVNLLPLNSEWLRPHGLLYNIARKQSSGGILLDNHSYTFINYGVTCVYDARKDMLVVQKSASFDKCSWCESNQLRLIHYDGTVLYENGDKTSTPVNSPGARCKCGFKHWYNGQEYDNPPIKIPISFEWKSRNIVEEVLWFQDESNPSLNSDPSQVAAFVIHKHLPGERDTGRARQAVQDLILWKSRNYVPSSTQTMAKNSDASSHEIPNLGKHPMSGIMPNKISKEHDVTPSSIRTSQHLKPVLDSKNGSVSFTPKKRHSDSHGGALPKQRSTPASLAAAAAISRAEANQVQESGFKSDSDSAAIPSMISKRDEDKQQTIRLGPGYSVISGPTRDRDDILENQKLLEKAVKATELLTSYFAAYGDPNIYKPRNAGKSSASTGLTKGISKRGEVMKSDPSFGSLSRVANLLNVGGNHSDCDDIMTDSDGEGSL